MTETETGAGNATPHPTPKSDALVRDAHAINDIAGQVRRNGAACAHKGCPVDMPPGDDMPVMFAFWLTDAGWTAVCTDHWVILGANGQRVFPPFDVVEILEALSETIL